MNVEVNGLALQQNVTFPLFMITGLYGTLCAINLNHSSSMICLNEG